MHSEIVFATRPGRPLRADVARTSLRAWGPLVPALVALALMIVWAAHDGGYDEDTWYWGALLVLGCLATLIASGAHTPVRGLSRPVQVALGGLTLYVAWSYLSISWAASPGDALTGSNRALLYLLVFAVLALTRWTPRRALAMVTLYALAVGMIGALLLVSMATGHGASSLFSDGRLYSPEGYYNATAALFTSAALVAVVLCVRRELPPLVRGALAAVACEGVALALLGESRGWLFTLPVVIVLAVLVSADRLRVTPFAALAVAGALAPLSLLLAPFRSFKQARGTTQFLDAAHSAGRTMLLICAVIFVGCSLFAAVEPRLRVPTLGRIQRTILGSVAVALACLAAAVGTSAATGGHPVAFIERQWHAFVHSSGQSRSTSSYFAVTGTQRYDAWRVALDAALAHPLGGLGQDNFDNYYELHGRTGLELAWTHSLEFRLLAHTGFVGLVIFAVFLGAALAAALRNRRRGRGLQAAVCGAALLPLIVWLCHGSVDWFWEMPALSGPALGFLAMAGSLGGAPGKPREPHEPREPRRLPRALSGIAAGAGAAALLASVAALGFPYLSVREVSTASDLRGRNPSAALRALARAADLNPLSAVPGRLAGTIALQTGGYTQAESSFQQSIDRDPGGWYAWFGKGLAASALGDSGAARRYLQIAARINTSQPAIRTALVRVQTIHPLTPGEALGMLVLAH